MSLCVLVQALQQTQLSCIFDVFVLFQTHIVDLLVHEAQNISLLKVAVFELQQPPLALFGFKLPNVTPFVAMLLLEYLAVLSHRLFFRRKGCLLELPLSADGSPAREQDLHVLILVVYQLHFVELVGLRQCPHVNLHTHGILGHISLYHDTVHLVR